MTSFDMFAALVERRLMRGLREAVVFRQTTWGRHDVITAITILRYPQRDLS